MIAVRACAYNTQRILQVNTRRISIPAIPAWMDDRRITKARRLRDARKAKFDTAAEAALAYGFKKPTLTSHENATRPFDDDDALRYAKAFKVSPSWLLALDSDPGHAAEPVVSEALLGQLLYALAPSFPKTEVSESAARALAAALKHALELLQETGATEPTEREIAMAARAAISQYRGGAAA